MEGRQMNPVKAYKRSPALTNSTWYKGMLVSEMAGTADNNGAFDLNIFKVRPGTEPPPHVHSREDEFFLHSIGRDEVLCRRRGFHGGRRRVHVSSSPEA